MHSATLSGMSVAAMATTTSLGSTFPSFVALNVSCQRVVDVAYRPFHQTHALLGPTRAQPRHVAQLEHQLACGAPHTTRCAPCRPGWPSWRSRTVAQASRCPGPRSFCRDGSASCPAVAIISVILFSPVCVVM